MRLAQVVAAFGTLIAVLLCAAGSNAQDRPGTTGVKPLMTLYGSDSKITKQKILRVTTAKEWDALWNEHRGGSETDRFYLDLDFEKVTVIAIFGGEGFGESCYTSQSITEDKNRITVRVDTNSYQSGYPVTVIRPWGILVLPRSTKKIVLERDVRGLIADPPKWKEWTSFHAISAPKP